MSEKPDLSRWPDKELAELVADLIDGRIGEEDQRHLEQRLREEPRAADYCAEQILFHSKLGELIGPSRVELIQNRRLLIEGRGSQRRVVIGQSQTAEFGGAGIPPALGGPPARSRSRAADWAFLTASIALLCVAATLLFIFIRQQRGQETSGLTADRGPTYPASPWHRQPKAGSEMRYWMQNMAWHKFNLAEMKAATGMETARIEKELAAAAIKITPPPPRAANDPLLVLPYPGGRHPRTGLQEQAVNPQRDTKVSVFTPWDQESYVVLDLPEAIRIDQFYYYLSHSDQPTLWSLQGVQLPPQEWERLANGHFRYRRELPNGVAFGCEVEPQSDSVRMKWWIRNETAAALRSIMVQNCVFLGGAADFARQTPENKVFKSGYAACRNPDGTRWVIVSWQAAHRLWQLEMCPCMHSDPVIPVCQPGETIELQGWLSFYEGKDIDAELDRIEATGWRNSG